LCHKDVNESPSGLLPDTEKQQAFSTILAQFASSYVINATGDRGAIRLLRRKRASAKGLAVAQEQDALHSYQLSSPRMSIRCGPASSENLETVAP